MSSKQVVLSADRFDASINLYFPPSQHVVVAATVIDRLLSSLATAALSEMQPPCLLCPTPLGS